MHLFESEYTPYFPAEGRTFNNMALSLQFLFNWHSTLPGEKASKETLDLSCREEDVFLEVLLLGILYIDVCVLHPVD